MEIIQNFKRDLTKFSYKKIKNNKLKNAIIELVELFDNSLNLSSPFNLKKLFNEFIIYLKYKDNKELISIDNPFENGQEGNEYKIVFSIPDSIINPEFVGLEEIGLKAQINESHCIISGILKGTGEKEVRLQDKAFKDEPPAQKFTFVIKPDPKKLWKDLPVPEGIEYPKPDTDCACLCGESDDGQPQINMVAASKRGRSHANEAKPRDDHFMISHCSGSGWYIIAVADGAGSCEFSRKGSEIACTAAVEFCEEQLREPDNSFDVFLKNFLEDTETYKNQLKPKAYDILVRAAYTAHRAIQNEAKEKNRPEKLYATTLLLTICKKLPDESYIILSFNIGDGATGIISKENDILKAFLNCTPDEGEFGGQTRFVTMSEVFKDSGELINRIHIKKVKDLTAIISMTDGISDAKFETDANLNNENKWIALWEDIKDCCPDNKTTIEKEKLLEWLDFWSAGNHDDRTIAILYSHEQCN